MVRDGVVITPARDSDILESVTRDTVLEPARENGLPTQERRADRTELYVADEVFVCGTGQELLPATSIDRLAVGDGRPGAITLRLQAAYESVVRGTTDAHAGRLSRRGPAPRPTQRRIAPCAIRERMARKPSRRMPAPGA